MKVNITLESLDMTHGQRRAQRIQEIDQFKRKFEAANTRLTLSCMALKTENAGQAELEELMSAAHALANVCLDPHSPNSKLEVLYWLLKKLKEIAQQPRGDVFQAHCKRLQKQTEYDIQYQCSTLGADNIVALL